MPNREPTDDEFFHSMEFLANAICAHYEEYGAAEITYMMSLLGRCESITDLYDAFDIAVDIIGNCSREGYYYFLREFRKRMEKHEN